MNATPTNLKLVRCGGWEGFLKLFSHPTGTSDEAYWQLNVWREGW